MTTEDKVFDDLIREKIGEKVDHPSHYNREGAMECIEEMILAFGKEKVADFCLCNAWKYRYRAADKNGIEDLKKSDWYMNKYKQLTQSSITLGPGLSMPSHTPGIVYCNLDKKE